MVARTLQRSQPRAVDGLTAPAHRTQVKPFYQDTHHGKH